MRKFMIGQQKGLAKWAGMVAGIVVIVGGAAWAQAVDPGLAAEIKNIRAIDNHTHVGKVVGPGEKDDDFDALPCYLLEPGGDTAWASVNNPRVVQAWKALYGYKYDDQAPEHVKELIAARAKVIEEQGEGFPEWVLDKLGTRFMLANRVAMGRGLSARFGWVPFDDALLTPVASTSMENTPDKKAFYAREAGILKTYMTEAAVKAAPTTLEAYVAKVVTPTLEAQKKAGAVAVKFEAAYLRPLDFAAPNEEEAKLVYAKYAGGGSDPTLAQRTRERRAPSGAPSGDRGAPSMAEVKALQDYLFRVIAREAGRLGLAVHIHTGTGCGTYFDIMGANPGNLESVLDDPSLRKTNFVLIHGGSGPWTRVAAFLMSKPNVYVDYSEQDAISPPWMIAPVLREWLEWYPEKVLYGTDLAPGPPELDWDINGYVTNGTARQALATALTGMVQNGDITRERAVEIARMVLHDNALKLYGRE
jgi:predicted TIM-barrel fold metal-dependent hydrolase